MPYILLNLCLSTLAGVQAAVLLIAAKRSDEVAAATALHTLENTEQLRQLIEQNTELTRIIHDHITATAAGGEIRTGGVTIASDLNGIHETVMLPKDVKPRRKRAARIPA